jgi:DNA-binding transcriptional regulator LsrR (DeoR family)
MSRTNVRMGLNTWTIVHVDNGAMTSNGAGDDLAGSEGAGLGDLGYPPSLLYRAAKLYYEDNATQAAVATALGTSRTTVSRLLAEARRQGIVQIAVVQPQPGGTSNLAGRLRTELGLDHVYLSAALPQTSPRRSTIETIGGVLAPALGTALTAVGLVPGDIMLVSSGRTMYEVAQHELPQLTGVVVAPTIGGIDQSERWYQTNEIVSVVASKISGRASYLFAPALPGPELHERLVQDPAVQRVLHLWPFARCVITSVGAPPILRDQLPQFIIPALPSLVEAAGDLCSRFFDRAGEPLEFPGSDRLVAVELETLKRVPAVIAVAAGRERVMSIIAAARKRYFNQLVTDPDTAEVLLSTAAATATTLPR